MKLFEGKECKILVHDYETLKGMIDLGFYDPDANIWYEFEISPYRNDLFAFVKFYTSGKYDYIVGYNSESFDCQVAQFIVENHQKWIELDNMGIVGEIYSFVQNLIDDQKYGLFVPYKPYQFSISNIDVFTMFGLNNEARWSSLKKIEFNIDYPNVEEMPIHHSRENLTREEIEQIKLYRKNDILATLEIFKMALGITEHPIYKGNNQIEFRFNIMEEYRLSCLSYSDIKIGEELMKLSYAKAIGVPIYRLPRKGTFRKEIHLKYCIPKYVQFKSKQLNELLKDVRNTTLLPTEDFEREFQFYESHYVMGLGGLHTVNRNEVYTSIDENKIRDWDVQSYYPAIVVNNGYYPYHLGKELLNVYKELYDRRIELKPLGKTDKRIKGIVEGLKLQMNVVFGKLGSMDSWLYDKQALLSVTLTGQFSLLMLVEMLEMEGVHVFSVNTDGLSFQSDKSDIITEVWNRWQKITGFVLEETRYQKITYLTVNDYIAVKEDGEIKKKGDLITDFDLWKNKSARVVPLALEQYFTKGTDPREFINNHKNIYDYGIMARATGNMHLEEQVYSKYKVTKEMLEAAGWTFGKYGWIFSYVDIWTEEAEKEASRSFEEAAESYRRSHQEVIKKHKKLVRYYLSSSSNSQLYKRGTGTKDQQMNTNLNAPNDLGDIYIQYFNQFEEKDNYHINKNQYIYRCYRIIDRVEGTKKAKKLADEVKQVNQLSLF